MRRRGDGLDHWDSAGDLDNVSVVGNLQSLGLTVVGMFSIVSAWRVTVPTVKTSVEKTRVLPSYWVMWTTGVVYIVERLLTVVVDVATVWSLVVVCKQSPNAASGAGGSSARTP